MLVRRGLGGDYRRLWTATAVSNVGDGIRETALPLLAATLTRDPVAVAGVAFANRLPWLLLSLVSGALVDRWDRRIVMTIADAARACLMIGLGAAVVTGHAGVAVLYVAAFLLGSAETLFDNAAHAILPSVVTREDLEKANGQLEAAMLIGNNFVGPAIGGLLFVALAASPFFLDGVSFALAALLVVAMHGRFRPQRKERPAGATSVVADLRQDIGEGISWLWRQPLLRALSGMSAVINLVLHATYAIFVLFALEVLHLSEVAFGLLLVAEAVGSFLGAMVASRVSARFGPRATIVGAILLAAATNLLIGVSSAAIFVAAMLVLLSVAGVTWNILTTSMRQSLVPDELLGRVNSAHRCLAWGAIPLGALLGGVLASTFGLRMPFLFAAVALLGVGLVATRVLTSTGEAEERRADTALPHAA
ncbi:MAG: MFS transporter [Actinomycetota bacterium]